TEHKKEMYYFENIARETQAEQDLNLDYIPEIKVIYTPNVPLQNRPVLHSSEQAVEILRGKFDPDTIQLFETFKVILLSPSNRILGIYSATQAIQTAVQVRVKLMFGTALKAGATSMIIAHNHPDDEARPSAADKNFTKGLKKIAKMLDIHLVDHIIISTNDYYSFREHKQL
ncbi:MAG: JAB domain-containing protein, partial [Bacteroidota bacterium]